MVLGHHPKQFKHMMKNMIASLILNERITTTHGKAKRLMRQANKLLHFAKKAEQGMTSPMNLLRGRVTTEQVYKKLLMETVPKLENISQNYVRIEKNIRYRRGDDAPVVNVLIRGSQKAQTLRLQARQAKQKQKQINMKVFSRKMFAQEKAYYQKMILQNPEKAEFFQTKISRCEYDEWILDKKKGEKRIQFIV